MREYNVVRKKISGKTIRVALIYPSTYEAMMSSLITHLIYFMINEYFEEVYVERFYLKRMTGNEPPPRSIETNTPLKEFDLIITSLHYEPLIAGLLRMLYSGGVSIWRRNREIPVIAGGPVVIANPRPYEEFIDAFIIGEAEETLPQIIESFIEYRDDKKRFLEEISSYKYTYVPGYTNGVVKRRWVSDLNSSYYPIKQIQSIDREPVYGRGFILETSRGCLFWCRFCMESRLFKPYRRRNNSLLYELVRRGLEVNGVDRVIIYSLLFPLLRSDKVFMEYLVSSNIKASYPSLRLEHLDDEILELIRESGQKSLTIAPESFNFFTQRIIAKYFDLDMVIDKINSALDKGFNLKLYLLFGIKGEKLDDHRVNIEVLRSIAGKAREKGLRISVSINPIIPKPKTVFQWIGMIDLGYARNVIRYYRRELRGIVETRPLHINWAWVQGSIALADNSIGRVLADWSIMGGDLGGWRRALRIHNYSTKYLFNGYRFGDELPWDNIVIGSDVEELLEREYMVIRGILGSRFSNTSY
jgi:radical SAM superfamily enzyme YgiQ (UPF0313 family)